MTDQTPPDQGENGADQYELSAEAKAAVQAHFEGEAKVKAKADEAAQAAGFADAAAKAAFDEKAKAAKPRRTASRRKGGGGFSVKMPTAEQFEQLCAIAASGGSAQLVLADGRKPIEGLAPVTVAMALRRGRPSNSAVAAFAGAALSGPVTVSHVFALEEGDKPTAAPLAIAELAAPMTLREGEQFKIGAGGIVFFPPPAQS